MKDMENSYQEVALKIHKDEEQVCTRYLSHKVALGAKHMDHLIEAVELPLNRDNNRVIIISDTKAYGYQAASYLLVKSQNIETGQSDHPFEFDYDEEDYDDIYEEFMDEYGEIGDAETSVYSRSMDMIIANTEIWDPKLEELSTPNVISMQRQASNLNLVKHAVNLLLYCSRRDQDQEKLMEEIENHLEQFHNLFLMLPSDSVSENFVERLVFEHDFSLIHVKEPSLAQLVKVFHDLTEKYGLEVAKKADIRSILQELKNYRKHLFWEKDIEKLICNTAKKVKGRVACEKDFSLYYYRGGQGVPGEIKLNKMIGQNEVKNQILRMVKSARLARLQQEKYGQKTAIYKHMAFEGAPGTGKTQIARITAQIFHEHGLSNGIFVEAGRSDLIAGYLGQTAIKIAKLFDRAKGGVIFIDEAGSLVQNNQDIYTKEAITTLIRYMENNPDTTVIFATYNDEMERLLDSDRGFRSRIAKIVEFQSYTDEELWEILKLMAANQHYSIDQNSREIVLRYIETLKMSKKEEFGNAREMRKLLQMAQEEMALRLFSDRRKSIKEEITSDDIKKAVNILIKRIPKKRQAIGFSITPSRSEYARM